MVQSDDNTADQEQHIMHQSKMSKCERFLQKVHCLHVSRETKVHICTVHIHEATTAVLYCLTHARVNFGV